MKQKIKKALESLEELKGKKIKVIDGDFVAISSSVIVNNLKKVLTDKTYFI